MKLVSSSQSSGRLSWLYIVSLPEATSRSMTHFIGLVVPQNAFRLLLQGILGLDNALWCDKIALSNPGSWESVIEPACGKIGFVFSRLV